MLVSLVVGKLDAGIAVLLTEEKRLIEFPSILLPTDITCGSVVDINVTRNHKAEAQDAKSFRNLQHDILSTFGSQTPSAPVLRCRNATQTSIVLEWDPISLAKAELRSLTLFRNGNKAGVIPRPLHTTMTKISGLALGTEYSFKLVLRTSAGVYTSETLSVRTHVMTDLTGIVVTAGKMEPPLLEDLKKTLARMGAKLTETIRIDTTHFVCTEGHGEAWERAVEANIPVVVPDWVKGCEMEGRLISVTDYYLDADPKKRKLGTSVLQREASNQSVQQRQQRSQSPQRQTPRTEITPPTPERSNKAHEEEGGESDDSQDEEPPPPPPEKPASPINLPHEAEQEQEADDDGGDESPPRTHVHVESPGSPEETPKVSVESEGRRDNDDEGGEDMEEVKL